MKIRRILATAVAAAVTTPVVLLSAAPAFAATAPAVAPAGQSVAHQKDKPTIAQLRKAVAEAQKAYDAARRARIEGAEVLRTALATLDDHGTHPLAVAYAEAKKKATEAAAAKTAADAGVTRAEEALKALPEDASEADRTAAEQAVTDAKAAAATAAAAKTAADAARDKASGAVTDERVRLSREYFLKYQKPEEEAKAALEAAQKALAEAESTQGGGECPDDRNLVTSLTGPKKIVAGSSGIFTFRVTNKSDKAFGEVSGFGAALYMGGEWPDKFKVSWSSVNSPKWQKVNDEEGFFSGAPLARGESFDFKLKVDVSAKAPAGDGAVFAIALRVSEDGECGMAKEASSVDFTIVKADKPGSGNGGGKGGGKGSTGGKGNGNTTGQGGSSNTPVNNGTSRTATGRLASTGAGSATLPIALAGGAAVVLGAGAMVVVRRRKAGADA